MPPQFRTLFHDPALQQPRYHAHHPAPPLFQTGPYQPQSFRHPMQSYQPPPPAVVRLPAMHDFVVARPADVHHHHHVYHYYYVSVDGGSRTTAVGRQPCDLVTAAGCPPGQPAQHPPPSLPPPPPPPQDYLPPMSPSPPTPTTVAPPPVAQAPCNDDTVVVDNVNYFPFGRSPIVVKSPATATDGNSRPANKSNFILANYLLPPDN